MLTGVSGKFDGGGESVQVANDGHNWYITGSAAVGKNVGAQAHCIRRTCMPDYRGALPGHLRGGTVQQRFNQPSGFRGFAALAGMSGHFRGFGEAVSVLRRRFVDYARIDSMAGALRAWLSFPLFSKMPRLSGERSVLSGSPYRNQKTLESARRNFCFLTRVAGNFRGMGEEISLSIEHGMWRLNGRHGASHQVSGKARCFEYRAKRRFVAK
jgi:hypothetical protein